MKTKLLTLALLLISAGTSAQKTFTLATLNEIGEEYKTNSKAFFTKWLSADFRYTTPTGTYLNRNDIVSGDAQKILKTEFVKPVIFQSGDLAIVSGIHKTERVGQDGNPVMGQVACTYTFQRRQGKWLFVGSQQTQIEPVPSTNADEVAVKNAIEGLTSSMYARDFKTYLNYWANAPYVSRVSTDREGKVTKMTGDEYRKTVEQYAAQNLKPSQEKATRDNWIIRVNGNSAFAVFDQHNQYPDGTTRHSVEERYLERMNGEWKVVNVTVLVGK